MEKVRRAKAILVWAGKDVSVDLAPFLKELSYTDTAEKGAKDELIISLFNKDKRFFNSWYPTAGDTIEAKISYLEKDNWHIFPLGKFTLDRIDFKFSPLVCNIRALSYISINRDVFKQKRSEGWENITLHGVVSKIAKQAGLTPIIECPDLSFSRFDIRQESYEEVLKRIAKEFNCKYNIKGDYLIFSNNPYPQSISLNLDANKEIEDGSLVVKIRDQVQAVKMEYFDPKTKQKKTYTAGDTNATGNTVKKIYGLARNLQEAKTKCLEALKSANSKTIEGDLTIIGKPISAGTTITIDGLGKLSGQYQVERITHTLSPSQGWSARLTIKGGAS